MDYSVLRFVWWLLIGVLLIGFLIMDGHDMGVGTLSPFVGRTDSERRIAINSVAPHWDGNQVWFITAGGAIFAAWPLVYAASFSMLYITILAVLWTIFLRAPAFDYRSKLINPKWRSLWDWVLFVGSTVPPLLFGVAFGNLFVGIPFHFANNMHLVSDNISSIIGFCRLLSPFPLLCGLVASGMVITHGAIYLGLRTDGLMQKRAKKATIIFSILTTVLFAVAGIAVSHLDGYIMTNFNPNGQSDPLVKTVVVMPGAWLNNYSLYPISIAAPILGFSGLVMALLFSLKNRYKLAFLCSSFALSGIVLTGGVSLFPFIMPSSSSLASSLTVWDATSSQNTLQIMLIVALIFTPIILIYTSWVYKIMGGKLTTAKIEENSTAYY